MALSWIELGLIGLLLVLPIAWKSSCTLRYNVKATWYFVYMMMTGFVVAAYAMWRPFHHKNIIFCRDLWNLTLPMFGWKTVIRNREHIEYMKPAVIVSNHQSGMDMIALMAAMPERTTVLAKKQLMYVGMWGVGAWLCGLVFIDRSNPEKAKATMAAAVKQIKDNNMKCWVFAEGTRRLDGKMHAFKKGAFHLAVQGQMPIIPVVMSSYLPFLDSEKKIFEPGKVIITCLPHVQTEGLTTADVETLTAKVHDQMVTVFDETSKEVADEMRGSSLSNGATS